MAKENISVGDSVEFWYSIYVFFLIIIFVLPLQDKTMSVNPDIKEIIDYLESDDPDIVRHFKNVVQEKLYTSRDHSLLGTLIDHYIQTKSERLLDLLVGVNDAHAMVSCYDIIVSVVIM